jgi:predicted aspartyl protease
LKVTRFDPKASLIFVPGMVWGRHGQRRLRLVVDTGSAETIIAPDVLDELGYDARQGEAITITRSAVGKESGYLIRVSRFRAFGFEFADFRVNALDLPVEYGINGLLGLGFLRHFNYEVRSAEGRIQVERIDTKNT